MGESPRLTAIAELLEEAVQREDGRGTVLDARKTIHLVDSKVGNVLVCCLHSRLGVGLLGCLVGLQGRDAW